MLKGRWTGLRAIERGDLEPLLAWRNNPDLRRFFREGRELGIEHQLEWFRGTVLADPRVRMFAIIELASGRLLGACGLCYIDWANRNADFSIYLGQDDLYIDDALAPDAARLLLRYGYEELGLHRMWAEIYDFDLAKKRLFDTLQFTLEGRHRQTHWTEMGWHDSLFYSQLMPEYERLRAVWFPPTGLHPATGTSR